MKVVSNNWSDLKSGYDLLTAENSRLHQKWARDIEAVRVSRHDKEHRAWRDRLTQVRARAAALRWPCLTIAGVGVVVMVVAIMAAAMPVLASGLVCLVGFAATTGTLLALYSQSVEIKELSRTEPSLDKTPRLSMDITAEWWNTIGTGAREQRVHGDIGEVELLTQLGAVLPDSYVCMRGILVAPQLDADVIVVGPIGLWIFDSKYWHGTIIVRNGQWSRRNRRKQYYEPVGYEAYRDDPIEHAFDAQWRRERDAVWATLERREPHFESNGSTLIDLIGGINGGIVFMHPQVDFDIDDSCSVLYGNFSYWVGQITNAHAGSVRAMPLDLCLAVFDALTAQARKLDASSAQRSASDLASSLAEAMDRKAAQFVAQGGGASQHAPSGLPSPNIRPSKGIQALLASEVGLTIMLIVAGHDVVPLQMAAFRSTDPMKVALNTLGLGIGVCLYLALIWVLPWALWLLVQRGWRILGFVKK